MYFSLSICYIPITLTVKRMFLFVMFFLWRTKRITTEVCVYSYVRYCQQDILYNYCKMVNCVTVDCINNTLRNSQDGESFHFPSSEG